MTATHDTLSYITTSRDTNVLRVLTRRRCVMIQLHIYQVTGHALVNISIIETLK